MCASCGCGCKMGKAAKGCKCTCKTCRDARTMSVEKSMLIRKAMRNFEAIHDAYLADDEDIEKAILPNIAMMNENRKNKKKVEQLSSKQMKIAGQAGNPKKIDAEDLAALRNRSRNQG